MEFQCIMHIYCVFAKILLSLSKPLHNILLGIILHLIKRFRDAYVNFVFTNFFRKKLLYLIILESTLKD